MYSYEKQKEKIFSERGQEVFLQVRDTVNSLLRYSGAFMMNNIFQEVTGDTWFTMACVDRLVELGEIVEIKPENYVPGQFRVFINKLN